VSESTYQLLDDTSYLLGLIDLLNAAILVLKYEGYQRFQDVALVPKLSKSLY
jgi:hypothetical protein